MSYFSDRLDFQGQTAAFTGAWSPRLDFAGQTLEDFGNAVWSERLDFSGDTQVAGLWSDRLDFAGQTALGFGFVSVGAFQPGEDCALTVVGVDAAYTIEVNGAEVSTTDDLDGSGDGTITFTAPRATAYGEDVTITLTMGEDSVSTTVVQAAEPGLAFFPVGAVVPQWAQGQSVAVGARRWNPSVGIRGRLYQATTPGTTGANAPVHTSGTASDGAVNWLHLGEYVRLRSTPDLEAGDQIAVNNVVGGTIAGVTVDEAALFAVADGVTSFDFGVWDGTEWGSFATQVIRPYLMAYLAVWDGAEWQKAPLKRWDAEWISHQLKRWDGTNWIEED